MENTVNRKSERETIETALRVAYVNFMSQDDGPGGELVGDCYIEEHPEIHAAIYLSHVEVGEGGAEDADWYRILYFDQDGRLIGAAVEMGGSESGWTWMDRQDFLDYTGTAEVLEEIKKDQAAGNDDLADGTAPRLLGCGHTDHEHADGPCPTPGPVTDNGVLQLTWCECDAPRLGFVAKPGDCAKEGGCGSSSGHAHCGHCGGILQARKPRTEIWIGTTGPATETGGRPVKRALDDFAKEPLPPRYDLANHSPDGFNWGYAGSGPTQLALAIAADFYRGDNEPTKTSDGKALAVYIDLKDRLIAGLPGQCGFVLTRADVAAAIKAIEDNPTGGRA